MGEGGRIYSEKGEIDAASRRCDPLPPWKTVFTVKVDGAGNLSIPPGLAAKLGLEPGGDIQVVTDLGGIEVLPNIHSLARLYIEPTSRCGLNCRTCVRNTWEEPTGDMAPEAFERIASSFGRFPGLESVMFGGIGEPTLHPDILTMIRRVKSAGLRAEMVTNGTRLGGPLLAALYETGLDLLWVSLDGTTERSFEDIRQGADFGRILESLRGLRLLNERGPHRVDLGIAFVLMRRNLADLKDLDKLARDVGARRVSVSHVLPYGADMEKEMLCLQTLTLDTFTAAAGKTEIDLPRLDVNNTTKDALFSLLQGFENLSFMGHRMSVDARHCRFIRDRCAFVRWDGRVSPCAGLLHTYRTYLYGLERTVTAYTVGDVVSGDLFDIWHSEEYSRFREKVRDFDYSPCHACGGCTMLEKNDEDCYGNTFPVCGGCLWAQGIIQCP